MNRLRHLTKLADTPIAHMIGRTDLSIEGEADGEQTINVETEWALRGLLAKLEHEEGVVPLTFVINEDEQTFLVSQLPQLRPHPMRARLFLRLLDVLKQRMMGEAELYHYQPEQAEGRGLGVHTGIAKDALAQGLMGSTVEDTPVDPSAP